MIPVARARQPEFQIFNKFFRSVFSPRAILPPNVVPNTRACTRLLRFFTMKAGTEVMQEHEAEREWQLLAHADFGAADCDGCLWPVIRGDQAEITCNSCAAVVRAVPVADLQRTYDEMELSLDPCAIEMCPRCGHINMFPGWTSMGAYTCSGCGELIRLSDDPAIELIFGPPDQD
jgi:hypothetical protein